MRTLPRFLYLLCFIGLAIVAALVLNRIVQPSAATTLIRAGLVATICGAPGLIHRRLWPLALALLPVGAYLLFRTVTPLPPAVEGIGEQYQFYTGELRQGASVFKDAVSPFVPGEAQGLQLFLAFLVYWVTGAAAFLSLSLRGPLPGVLLILVFLGYTMTIDEAPPVYWSALLFVILSACLLVFSRALQRKGWRLWDMAAGGAIGIVASLLAFLLLLTTPSVAATPWQDWHTFGFFRQGGSTYMFNWLQDYPRLLNPNTKQDIMRVESPSPAYWRATALDSFTGTAWVTSQAFLHRVDVVQADGTFTYYVPEAELAPAGLTVTEVFEIQSVYTNYFFIGGDPQTLSIDQDVALRMNDMRSLRVGNALGPTLNYTATAIIPALAPADLVGLGTNYPADLDGYLTLPFPRSVEIVGSDKATAWRSLMLELGLGGQEWINLYELNQRIIDDATDPYDLTLRIERYLRRYYEYSLAPPATDYSSPYAAFLFETRTGYCQHFAGAMALLLRFNGIPACVAVGFTAGEIDRQGVYVVSTNNAHAWVEVYFPGVGWVTFDPTPGRNVPVPGPSSTSPGFINPFAEDGASGPAASDPTLPRDLLPKNGEVGEAGPETQGSGWLSTATWLPWTLGLLAILLAWPLVRSLWRKRRLHRGSPEQRLQASLALLRSELSDYKVPVSPAHTLEEVQRAIQTHLGMDANLAFVQRAEAVLFGGRGAKPEDVRQAESLRREVKTRLRKRHGWVRTGLAWYGVRRLSLVAGQRP